MSMLSRFFARYKLHVLFWTVYLIFWSISSAYTYNSPPGRAILLTFVFMIGQGAVSYWFIYRLIPRYLHYKRYWTFVLLALAGLVVAAGFIESLMVLVLRLGGARLPMPALREFLYTIMGNCYMVFLVFAVKSLKDRMQQERRTQLLEKEKTVNELRFLKSQMNPHFLFNAINSIYVLIKKDPDFAAITLVKFADMLRYQLYECNADEIPIEKEVSYLNNYIELEKLRKGSGIRTEYEVGEAIRNFSIAPLLIIPFVENAFKYVSSCPDRKNFVAVHLNYQDNIFELSVENTMDEDTVLPKDKGWGGIGLGNVRRRLELIYNGRHALDISSMGGIYSVLLTIKISP